MDFRTLSTRRKRAGLCGTLILCLVLALAFDGMIAGGRKDPNRFDLTPGTSLPLSDLMPRGAESLDAVTLRSSSPDISVRMVETFTGFWLGGTLWRAEAALAAHMPLGEYTLALQYQNGTEPTPRQVFRFRVHQDERAVQQAALALSTRLFGVSPYFLAACLLPLALLPMAASFLLSRTIGLALRAEGMSEIFRAMASPEGQRIFFSLAPDQEIPRGASVQVLDERGETLLGTARIHTVTRGDVEAIMQDGAHVRPGTLAKTA